MYTIKEEREITPVTCAHLVSSTLYKRRFGPYFMEPIVVVLEPIPMLGAAEAASAAEDGEEKAKRRFKPCIASTDLIGCISWPKVQYGLDLSSFHSHLYLPLYWMDGLMILSW
jgi:20S proteasome subunit beta 3